MTWPRNAPIHLTGADANGIPWRVEMLLPHRRLWRITQANRPTYFFEGLTAGNGMAPSLSILALSFDSRRRPVPYYTDTLGGFSSSLLALDSERPYWVQQHWMEGNPGYRVTSEEPWGYYLTSLYRFDGLYWSQAMAVTANWPTQPLKDGICAQRANPSQSAPQPATAPGSGTTATIRQKAGAPRRVGVPSVAPWIPSTCSSPTHPPAAISAWAWPRRRSPIPPSPSLACTAILCPTGVPPESSGPASPSPSLLPIHKAAESTPRKRKVLSALSAAPRETKIGQRPAYACSSSSSS